MTDLIERLRARAAHFRSVAAECGADFTIDPPEPEEDRHYYCTACASNGVSAQLFEEAADTLQLAARLL